MQATCSDFPLNCIIPVSSVGKTADSRPSDPGSNLALPRRALSHFDTSIGMIVFTDIVKQNHPCKDTHL